MIAALAAWHEAHETAAEAVADVEALPAHALIEAYSVLTRLPGGLAVEPAQAARVLSQRFPRPPLNLTNVQLDALPQTLAAADVFGGASYDGLVALQADANDHELLTLDVRAQQTYRRLSVRFVAL